MQEYDIVVIGAGAAGMMAAIRAAQLHPSVVLIEKNAQPGKKLLLSGKGRGNLSNISSLDDFLENFGRNSQFLRDTFRAFFNRELIAFFENKGLYTMALTHWAKGMPSTSSV